MSGERNSLRYQLAIFGPAALVVIVAFVVAYQFIQPAPPDRVVMATGSPEGAYHAFARRYAAYLADEGITLELRPSNGSIDNLQSLADGEVGLALVQGGSDETFDGAGLTSLGSVYYEPLWLFHRADLSFDRLGDLQGYRVAAGPTGSGTRALALRLLRDNGVDTTAVSSLGGGEAVDALQSGGLDAVFLVISARSELIDRLLRDPRVRPFDFARAPAYTRRYGFLSALTLPEGVVDLAGNVPSRPVRLLAPTANLVAHPDLHPAVVDLVLQAATRVHREPGWFAGRGEFPKPEQLAFPLNPDAERYYEHGPPLLQRYLPFWAASLVDRLKIMLLPLLVLMLPLFRIMPPLYTWRMRARIYRWYDQLERAELDLQTGRRERPWFMGELDRIEREVQQIQVPLSFSDQLYHLREHIELVRKRQQIP
jgi:TRAP transporter TAXI family solute receptor